jgi:hypothetical protein
MRLTRPTLIERFPVGTPVTLNESPLLKWFLVTMGGLFAVTGVSALALSHRMVLGVLSLAMGVLAVAMRKFGRGGLWLRADEHALSFSRPFWPDLTVPWESIARFDRYSGAASFCTFELYGGSLAGTTSRWRRLLPGTNFIPTRYAGASVNDLREYLEAWRQAYGATHPRQHHHGRN